MLTDENPTAPVSAPPEGIPMVPTNGQLESNGLWRIAFSLSEMENDAAPIGWWRYLEIAQEAVDKARALGST